jgi:putative oxidoreductase
MRLLFSSFPNGIQGRGLLLLRVTLAGGLFGDLATRLHEAIFPMILVGVGEALTAVLLVIGLGTPLVALLVCVLQGVVLLMTDGAIVLHAMLAAVSVCLAVMGPGAWSIDARLFGRRRVDIQNLRGD